MKTDKQFRDITIEEYFEKDGDNVYRYWKLLGEVEFRKELTPYKDIPWVKVNLKTNKSN